MEGEEAFKEIEWIIENFSCWNEDIHGKVIKICGLDGFAALHNGLGKNDHLILVTGVSSSKGDLSLFDSGGSLLSKQKLKEEKSSIFSPSFSTTFTGLKFKDVVQRIKAAREDSLTLCWQIRSKSESDKICVRTVIDVYDMCFEVPYKVFEDLECHKNEEISQNFYPVAHGVSFKVLASLMASKNGSAVIIFKFDPIITSSSGNFLIRNCLSALNIDGEVIHSEENEIMLKDAKIQTFTSSLLRSKVVEQRLTVVLKMKIILPKEPTVIYHFSTKSNYLAVSADTEKSSQSLKTTTSNDSESSITVLTKELECLYQDQDFSDFQIRCENVCFPIHKGILSARSPVFKCMLSSGMKESSSEFMEISDLDVHTLGRFLTFLYTGRTNDLQWENALKLYYAADKYEVPSLSRECSSVLLNNVSVSNVCDILSLGHTYQDGEIISAAQEFVSKHYDEVLRSDEWGEFMEKDSFLLLRTITDISKKGYLRKNV